MDFTETSGDRQERSTAHRRRKKERKIAYFTMEVGIHPRMPTYSGGLGVLAGDTIKSCADLNLPLVAVTLLYRKGYFFQKLDAQGRQRELPDKWNPKDFLTLLKKRITVTIEKRTVSVQAWRYIVAGKGGGVPILFLDTDIGHNSDFVTQIEG